MKCKLNHELSKLTPFANDAQHKYLRAVFVPVEMNMLESLSLGTQAQFTINIYPGRDADGNIIEDQHKQLVEGFENGAFDNPIYYVDRINVEVEPFVMKRSRDSQFGEKGKIIMDGTSPRIYHSVAITCFHKIVDGKEVPAIDENTLKSRALAVKAFRIKNKDWINLSDYAPSAPNPESHDETPTDEGYDEAQDKSKEQDAKAKETEEKRKQLEAELAALGAPEKF